MVTRAAISLSLAVFTACSDRPPADDAPANLEASGVVVLRNGANSIDLLGDGSRGQAFVGWRGNFNAHGFSTVTFFAFGEGDRSVTRAMWLVVPFFGGPNDGNTGRESYYTREGADCTLGDIRVVARPSAPAEVIIANRDLGNSFADSAAVHFDYYHLVHNAAGSPGWPAYYFQHYRRASARSLYCDVNDAFDRELHLGASGLGTAEGLQ